MDKLKQYLQAHCQEMDVDIPPTDLLLQIQAGAVAPATNAVLIKYIITISIVAVISTGTWLIMQQQKAVQPSAPSTPPKEVIQKDTVPVQKDTMRAQPVIQPPRKKLQSIPPALPVIHKHKKSVDTVDHPTQLLIKKKISPPNHPDKLLLKKKSDTTVQVSPPRIKMNTDTVVHRHQPFLKKKVPASTN